MTRRATAVLALATSTLCLAACSKGEPEKVTETVTTTKIQSSESSSSANKSSDSSTSRSSKSATQSKTTSSDDSPTGYTGAPTGEPTAINKNIARCAKSSEGLYQQGTTWFTDGTSGWTQYCANNFYDGPPANSEPIPQTTQQPAISLGSRAD